MGEKNLIFYNDNNLSELGAYALGLVKNTSKDNIKRVAFLGNILYNISQNKLDQDIYLVGHYPNTKSLLNLASRLPKVRIVLFYPYTETKKLDDSNIYIYGCDTKQVKNILSVIELYIKNYKVMFKNGRDDISLLYYNLETGNVKTYSQDYNQLLLLLSNGLKDIKLKDNIITAIPYEGHIRGTSLNSFDYMWVNTKGAKTLLIPQEANFMAYRYKALAKQADALAQLKFGMRSDGYVRFVVFNSNRLKNLVAYFKEKGFEDFKVNGNVGYGIIKFNWEKILR